MKSFTTWFQSMLAAACFCASARAEVMTFDSLTNDTYFFPIPRVNSISLGDLMLTGPYGVIAHSVVNPNNGTRAVALDSTIGSDYVLTLPAFRAPFALISFDVVSLAGGFVLYDDATGASYTNNGTTGRITLGNDFSHVVYVNLRLDGLVVIDNIEYALLEHPPVAAVRVLNELILPPIDDEGRTILDSSPPSHLGNPGSYQYPGYRGFWHYVLAPGTNPVPFVVDASASTDLAGDPLTFRWEYYVGGDHGDFYPLAGGVFSSTPYFTNQPPYLGNKPTGWKIRLEIRDPYQAPDYLWFGVRVLSPQKATDIMRDWLDEDFHTPRHARKRRLIATLARASADFANGRTKSGTREMKLFQLQIRKHLLRVHRRVSKALWAFSQAIIEAVKTDTQ